MLYFDLNLYYFYYHSLLQNVNYSDFISTKRERKKGATIKGLSTIGN
jgi:hypothetical protein